tara:strand:+ start:489 stop:710 length:222 start_codon:yes stop_codon:yes gene_type:complete
MILFTKYIINVLNKYIKSLLSSHPNIANTSDFIRANNAIRLPIIGTIITKIIGNKAINIINEGTYLKNDAPGI